MGNKLSKQFTSNTTNTTQAAGFKEAAGEPASNQNQPGPANKSQAKTSETGQRTDSEHNALEESEMEYQKPWRTEEERQRQAAEKQDKRDKKSSPVKYGEDYYACYPARHGQGSGPGTYNEYGQVRKY